MKIAPLTIEHAPRVAQIHASALAGDFLPSLGTGFLTELYRGILGLELGFGFVALTEGAVAGFVIASEDTSALFSTLLRARFLPLGLRVAATLLRKPRLLANVLETFTYPKHEGRVNVPAELVVIAVDGTLRSEGAGAALCGALDNAFRQRGIARYKVTVNQSNNGANRFYERQGFELAYSFTLYKRGWNLYTRTLPV